MFRHGITVLTVNEGLCVQIMHLGAFDDEPATVEIMNKFIHENGYVNDIMIEGFTMRFICQMREKLLLKSGKQ